MPTDITAYVYLGFYGDFDPYEVAKLLPLVPDKCVAKHSKKPEHRIPRKSILRYAQISTNKEIPDIYDLADEVLKILLPHREVLEVITKKYCAEVVFQVVLYFTSDDNVSTPAIGFTPEVISFITSLGASVDIDTYRA